ncbi:MAG: ABC transporter ATP-binding protein/permease [Gemmatimonadetes bacterium]|nr:ABC transporter ATP-binding protein/permease [Gemmatimonadota bacterium]
MPPGTPGQEADLRMDLRILARFLPFLRPRAGLLALAFGLMAAGALLALVRPLVMKYGLDGLASQGGTGALVRAGVLLGIVVIGEQLILYPQMLCLALAGARSVADLREHLFSFLQTRRLAMFDRTESGVLVANLTHDVDSLGELFTSGTLTVPGDALRLTGATVVMLLIDWRLALVALAIVPVAALGVTWFRRRFREAYRHQRVWAARLGAFVGEHVLGVSVVQSYGRERQAVEGLESIAEHHYGSVRRTISAGAVMDALVETMFGVCLAAVLWYTSVRVTGEPVSFGTMVAFVIYLDMFFLPIRNAMLRQGQMESALAAADRIFALLDAGEEDAPGPRAAPEAPAGSRAPVPALELEGVQFAYAPGTPVLRGVSLRVMPGERVALVGPTGSGKSTIAAMLLRLYEPDAGTVRVFGQDVRTVPREALRARFAVVPQDVVLYAGTVLQNVAAGAGAPDRERAREALAAVGALEWFGERPGGLDAPVAEGGGNLSVGERQMLAFARALYRSPPVLVLDEPTASIDTQTEARLLTAVQAALEGRTVLVIAHRLATLRSVDRIVVLDGGRVVEEGTHAELLALGGMYARFHRLQSARQEARFAAAAHPAPGHNHTYDKVPTSHP